MQLINVQIKILLIASICFMQTSNALAAIFLNNSDVAVQMCTSNGIKTLYINNLGDSKKSFTKTELMHCCLDVHSNFIISNYNNVDNKYLLYLETIVFKNTIKPIDFGTEKTIRAPPVLA